MRSRRFEEMNSKKSLIFCNGDIEEDKLRVNEIDRDVAEIK